MRPAGPAATLLIGATVIAVLPVLLPNEYYLTVLIVAGLNGIIALGLNLLMGYAGQISLGHAAFYGLAAYTTGILTATYHWPVPAGMAAAVALVLAVSALIAVPTLRLKGHYLAMGTLGFGLIVYIVLNEATGLTGGPSGLGGIPRLSLAGRPVTSDLAYYYVVWAAVLLCFAVAGNLVRSRLGRALRAIHTSETAAAALGIDTERTKIGVFVLSACMAAVAGTLYAHYVRFVSPGTFGFAASVQLVTMVVLGGMGSLWGGLAGAVVLTVLPEVLRALEDYDIVVYGLLLILCMMYLPGGLVEGVDRLWRLVTARRLRLAPPEDPA
ncbi:MAG TPA: branched-chain amino acid ABC transporter permease [Candidatus Baltobacteraceae bacterium]|nr:branched-chain amino acid ABC transporter permease [Candidatus Baltobacteraceae bacterium]